MPAQRHVVKRQLVEVKASQDRLTPALQDEVSRLCRTRFLALLEQTCDRLVDADTLCRIDLLEVDLGEIPFAQFREAMEESFSSIIARSVAQAIEAASTREGRTAKTASHLELVATFAKTGTYPWWAPMTRPGQLRYSLLHLAEHASEDLEALLRELGRDSRQLRRLVLALGDDDLAAVLDALTPAGEGGAGRHGVDLLAWVESLPEGIRIGRSRLRLPLWLEAMRMTVRLRREGWAWQRFGRAMLIAAAQTLRISFPELASRLGAHPNEVGSSRFLGALAEVFRSETEAARSTSDEIARFKLALASLGVGWSAVFEALETSLAGLPASWRAGLVGMLQDWADHPPSDPADWVSRGRSLTQWLGSVVRERALSSRVVHDLLRRAEERPDELPEALMNALQALRETLPPERRKEPVAEPKPLDLKFSDADAVYIANAGLVVLWPFLTRFFDRLGLLEAGPEAPPGSSAGLPSGPNPPAETPVEGRNPSAGPRRFRDEPARNRAAGLLQHLASGEVVPHEHLLPLNKLLCGMALDDPFEFGAPVTEEESKASSELLGAVIQHATILHNMSLAGFRQSLLLRQGQISLRDGAWLLRVERETYDVVLDKFPWPFRWVRLPWMTAPLQVEW